MNYNYILINSFVLLYNESLFKNIFVILRILYLHSFRISYLKKKNQLIIIYAS